MYWIQTGMILQPLGAIGESWLISGQTVWAQKFRRIPKIYIISLPKDDAYVGPFSQFQRSERHRCGEGSSVHQRAYRCTPV